MTMRPRFGQATFIGAFTAAMGLLILSSAREFETAHEMVIAGPGLFPILIGSGLLTLGLLQLMTSIRNGFNKVNVDIATQNRHGWVPVFWVLGGVGAFLVTLRPLGLVVAGTLLYLFVTHAFDRSKWKIYTLIGLLVAVFAFLLFSRVLRLQIPVGTLFQLILR